jgi:hypothetical protein
MHITTLVKRFDTTVGAQMYAVEITRRLLSSVVGKNCKSHLVTK